MAQAEIVICEICECKIAVLEGNSPGKIVKSRCTDCGGWYDTEN